MHRLRWILICFAILTLVVPTFAQPGSHLVQPGENLFRIAQQYGIDVNVLAQANGITNTWQIYAGQTLAIPGLQPAAVPIENAATPAIENVIPVATAYYTVQRGDQLWQIAQLYNLTTDQLAQLNNITNPNLIYAGQQLVVGTAADPQTITALPTAQVLMLDAALTVPSYTTTTQATHVVQPGEHLATIAQRYGVSTLAITQANNIYNPDHILAGQSLVIPGAAGPTLDYPVIGSPAAPAAPIGFGREVVVDLSDSRVYAYENGILQRNVLVSTGLPGTPTVQGNYTVERKYFAQTMVGPGYYLPDVPYVMYFYEGYALHGTYWHNNFGQPMSHGCVNMPTPEAEWVYNWTDIGTPVHVQW